MVIIWCSYSITSTLVTKKLGYLLHSMSEVLGDDYILPDPFWELCIDTWRGIPTVYEDKACVVVLMTDRTTLTA